MSEPGASHLVVPCPCCSVCCVACFPPSPLVFLLLRLPAWPLAAPRFFLLSARLSASRPVLSACAAGLSHDAALPPTRPALFKQFGVLVVVSPSVPCLPLAVVWLRLLVPLKCFRRGLETFPYLIRLRWAAYLRACRTAVECSLGALTYFALRCACSCSLEHAHHNHQRALSS